VRYLITFTCYGTRIHGDESGSVDPSHNRFGTRLLDPDPKRVSSERAKMTERPYSLDRAHREAVLVSTRDVCQHRGCSLLAAHVRTNHVHIIVEADATPEKLMNAFKAYATRRLEGLAGEEQRNRRWARHGSTRWLWKDEDVREAIHYVVEGQGETMAVFISDESLPDGRVSVNPTEPRP
jgi:REP element-mobilizing transposase RayT